jgi:hypothetical protein
MLTPAFLEANASPLALEVYAHGLSLPYPDDFILSYSHESENAREEMRRRKNMRESNTRKIKIK